MSGGHGLTRLTVNYLDRVSSKSECKRTTWTFVDKFLPNDLYLNYKEKLDVDHPLYSVFLFLGIVVGVFYLCWIPFMIAVVLSAFSETLVTPVVVLVISTIVYSNSAINPVLYGYLNRDFRLAYKRLASRISCPYTGGLHGPHERSYDVSELSARHTPPQHVQGAYYLTDKQ